MAPDAPSVLFKFPFWAARRALVAFQVETICAGRAPIGSTVVTSGARMVTRRATALLVGVEPLRALVDARVAIQVFIIETTAAL